MAAADKGSENISNGGSDSDENFERTIKKLYNKRYYMKKKAEKVKVDDKETESPSEGLSEKITELKTSIDSITTLIKQHKSEADMSKLEIVSSISSVYKVLVDKLMIPQKSEDEKLKEMKKRMKYYRRLANFYSMRSMQFQKLIENAQRTTSFGPIMSTIIYPIPEKNKYEVDYSSTDYSDESEEE